MRLCIWGVREEESKETEPMLCQEAKRKEVTRVSHSRKVEGDKNKEVSLLDLGSHR